MNKNNILNFIAFTIVGAVMGFVFYLFWIVAVPFIKDISIVFEIILSNFTIVILIVGAVVFGIIASLIVSWAIGRVFNFFMPKDDYIDVEKIKESCKEVDKMKQFGRGV